MKSIQEWLALYSENHQNKTNILIHWLCVPLIYWSISGMLFMITMPFVGNLAIPVFILVTLYYFLLSRTIWAGILIFNLICLAASWWIYIQMFESSLYLFLFVFSLAWIAQFAGYKIEGRRPSFFKDIQFLLIGPAWLMAKIYKSLRIPL